MNGRKILLLTASGILVAVLLVWVQLWTDVAQDYRDHGYSLLTAAYGLTFVYYAMAASITSFVIILLSKSSCCLRWALVFLIFAVIIAWFEVVFSMVSTTMRTFSNSDTVVTPTGWFVDFLTLYQQWLQWVAIIVAPIILLVICGLLIFCNKTKTFFNHLIDP